MCVGGGGGGGAIDPTRLTRVAQLGHSPGSSWRPVPPG